MKKSTKLAHLHHKMRAVSLFGSALFIIAVAVQSVATGAIIWYFGVSQSYMSANTVGLFCVLALAALLPPLAAFMIGDRSTKVRSHYEHFYNGVLFAFMTIWLSTFISFYVAPALFSFELPYLAGDFYSVLPAVIALGLVIAIGVGYGHKRHQKLLHEYLPFKLAFIIPLLALVAGGAWDLVHQLADPNPSVYGMMVVVPVIIQVAMLGISYLLSSERKVGDRLVEASVCASIGFFAAMIAGQLPYFGFGIATDIIVPSAIGVLVWLAFLYFYFYRRTDKLN